MIRCVGLMFGGVLLLAAMPAVARETIWEPAGATRCSFGGWQNHQIDGAIQVYAGPSAGTRILGTIPSSNDESFDYSILFDIVGTSPGWVQIDHATDDYNEVAGHPRRTLYEGRGWIAADAARLSIQSARGYARPDAGSARVLDLGDDWLGDAADLVAINGCSGEWILLSYRLRRTPAGAPISQDRRKTEKA